MVDVHQRCLKLGVSITAKFSKEGCIPLITRGRPSYVAFKHDWNKCGSLKNIFFQNGFIKNIKPIAQIWSHESHESQFLKTLDGAQSSIKKRPIPLKDIGSQV